VIRNLALVLAIDHFHRVNESGGLIQKPTRKRQNPGLVVPIEPDKLPARRRHHLAQAAVRVYDARDAPARMRVGEPWSDAVDTGAVLAVEVLEVLRDLDCDSQFPDSSSAGSSEASRLAPAATALNSSSRIISSAIRERCSGV